VKNWRGARLKRCLEPGRSRRRRGHEAQELCEPSQEQTKAVAGSSEDSVDVVAKASPEMIAVHTVLGLDVPDDRLDGRTMLHLVQVEAVTRRA